MKKRPIDKDTTFEGVHTLDIKGAGEFRLHDDGLLKGVTKVVQKGEKLTIWCGGGGDGDNMVVVGDGKGGNIIFMGANYGIAQQNIKHTYSFGGNGLIASVGDGGSVTVSRGGNSVTASNGSLAISGGRISSGDFVKLLEGRRKKQTPDDEPAPIYRLGADCTIGSANISGSAECSSIAPPFLADDFSVFLQGSGTFVLPAKHFTSLHCTLQGSGDICGQPKDGTTTDMAMLSLQGSGDICKILIKRSGSAHLMGSGDLRVRAVNPKAIAQHCTGSGDLVVTKAK